MLHKMSVTPRVIDDVTEAGPGQISPYDSKLMGIPSDQSHSRSMKSIDAPVADRIHHRIHPAADKFHDCAQSTIDEDVAGS